MSAVDFSDCPDVCVLAGGVCVDGFPLPPFSDEACMFLDAVSKELMSDARAKRYPDVISFAYWCRRGNVQREKKLRESGLSGRLGRGLAFHIAPGNVPVNFAFSYAFSLLAGNASIVRCPTKAFDQVEIILAAMRRVFPDYPEIATRSSFVTYPSSGDATKWLSSKSDVRVIWGGDATVRAVRSFPAKARCVDIAFADRYSIALFNAEAVEALDEMELAKMVRGFYNDTYLMDQNACSSPQTVLWAGDERTVDFARNIFWSAVEAESRRRYELQAAVSVDKRVQLMSDIARNIVCDFEEHGGYLTTELLAIDAPLSTDLRGVGGFFYEKRINNISDIATYVNAKYQTLVQFGFDSKALRDEVVSLHMTGIDRIVNVGNAMDIGLIWDGYDLIDTMSRIVSAS